MTPHYGSTSNTRSTTLYCIDIENLSGTSDLDIPTTAKIYARLLDAAPEKIGDHFVIASSHYNAEAAWYGWGRSAHRLLGSGPDGADLALLDWLLDVDWVTARYACVVLAAGDHIYAQAVAMLKAAGCRVIVVPPDIGLSKELKFAAGEDLVRLGSPIPDNVIPIIPRRRAATA